MSDLALTARPVRRSRGPGRGYTAIEVLIAMTVMAIGAAAVISMQRAAVQGNLDARKADMANTIARTWAERLERDAMQWTQPGPTSPAGNNMATAKVVAAGIAAAGSWIEPGQYLSAGLSPGFDILGRDMPDITTINSAIFCANVRLNWLTTSQDLIRADVRVLWSRGITSSTAPCSVCPSSGTGACDPKPDPTVFHAIYLTTSIRGNPQ